MYRTVVEDPARYQDRLAEQATEILAGAIAIAHAIEEARLRPPRSGPEDLSRLFQEETENV